MKHLILIILEKQIGEWNRTPYLKDATCVNRDAYLAAALIYKTKYNFSINFSIHKIRLKCFLFILFKTELKSILHKGEEYKKRN